MQNRKHELCVLMHACHLSTQEAEAGGLPWVQDQLGLCNKTLFLCDLSQKVEKDKTLFQKERKEEKNGQIASARLSAQESAPLLGLLWKFFSSPSVQGDVLMCTGQAV